VFTEAPEFPPLRLSKLTASLMQDWAPQTGPAAPAEPTDPLPVWEERRSSGAQRTADARLGPLQLKRNRIQEQRCLGRDVANTKSRLRLKWGDWTTGVRSGLGRSKQAVFIAEPDSCAGAEHDPGRSGAGRIARSLSREIVWADRNPVAAGGGFFPTPRPFVDVQKSSKEEFERLGR